MAVEEAINELIDERIGDAIDEKLDEKLEQTDWSDVASLCDLVDDKINQEMPDMDDYASSDHDHDDEPSFDEETCASWLTSQLRNFPAEGGRCSLGEAFADAVRGVLWDGETKELLATLFPRIVGVNGHDDAPAIQAAVDGATTTGQSQTVDRESGPFGYGVLMAGEHDDDGRQIVVGTFGNVSQMQSWEHATGRSGVPVRIEDVMTATAYSRDVRQSCEAANIESTKNAIEEALTNITYVNPAVAAAIVKLREELDIALKAVRERENA